MKIGKVWGTTAPLLQTPVLEIHQLEVWSNSHCSRHRHRARWNAFYVTTGMLVIEVESEDYKLVDVTELYEGDMTTVPPGLWHRFRSGAEGASCIEIYYPELLGSSDIERSDVGGRKKQR